MPKIQDVGVGNYIRDPRGRQGVNSRQTNVQILKVEVNQGNGFLCYPVKAYVSGVATLDYTSHLFIPIDSAVKQATP